MRFPRSIFRQLWLDGLRLQKKPGTENFKDWIASGKGYSITSLIANSSVELIVHTEAELIKPLAFEVNQWASSAFETLCSIKENSIRVNSIAWPLIQLYYGAFFSAHCILRVFGRVFTQFKQPQILALRASAIAVGINPDIEKGFYSFIFDPSLKTLKGVKMKDSHADTWSAFLALIIHLSQAINGVKAVNSDKLDGVEFLSKLQDILQDRGKLHQGNWLSNFRNDVNYKKQFGVWFPYNKSNPTTPEIAILIKRWRLDRPVFDLNYHRDEVLRFIEACVAINSMCRSLILEFDKTKTGSKHFVHHGGVNFLQFAKCI